jgi:hypothetical protein
MGLTEKEAHQPNVNPSPIIPSVLIDPYPAIYLKNN